MIDCYVMGSEFYLTPVKLEDFDLITRKIADNRENENLYPIEAIIGILNEYGRKLGERKDLFKYEGVGILAQWLKKRNIESILKINIKDLECLNKFVKVDNNSFIKAQPRGIVCSFMAGNVPTLSIYSLIQVLLCRNINIIRVPSEIAVTVCELLKPLSYVKVDYNGEEYFGKDLLKDIFIINFSSKDNRLNRDMSLIADVRVIYGGEDAVNSITAFPKKTTCKDIIFGPKYSLAVVEKSAVNINILPKYFDALVQDIISFEQKACSSPHVVFVERSSLEMKEVGKLLSISFEKALKRSPVKELSESIASKILNKRGEYLLSKSKEIMFKNSLDYTILIDKEVKLEEPIYGRTIFLKEIEDIFEICRFITPRIQTIGIASEDEKRIIDFADKVSLKGVDRIVRLGCMNFYDSPWDGILFISEMIKWTTLNC